MSGTYKDVDWTGGASKDNTFATPSEVDVAKTLKAGLKKPTVNKVANHQRMAEAVLSFLCSSVTEKHPHLNIVM